MSQHIIRKKPLVPSLPERLSGAEVENWKVYCFDDYTGPPVRSGRGPEGTRESAVEFNTTTRNARLEFDSAASGPPTILECSHNSLSTYRGCVCGPRLPVGPAVDVAAAIIIHPHVRPQPYVKRCRVSL